MHFPENGEGLFESSTNEILEYTIKAIGNRLGRLLQT
jgi:hypothetical protein